MKIVKVNYTTTPEYAGQNKANIELVMSDLRQLNDPGIRYHSVVAADGVSFMHYAFFESDAGQQILFNLSSFMSFLDQLKASGPVSPPKNELLTLIGSSYDIF